MEKKKFVENRIRKLERYIKNLDEVRLRELKDTEGLLKPGLYFIYDRDERVVYIGTTDRPLSERLRELRSYPKDHTFHSKLVRDALEKRLNRKIKGYKAKNLSKFKGHTLLPLEDFKTLLKETKLSIAKQYRYRTIEFENTFEDLKQAKAVEHFAISIFEPIWNDEVERLISELPEVELFSLTP